MREIRPTLFLLWGGVAFVLLIGAVNVTNLMMVRSSGRMKELATRHALGAGIGTLARQLLTETLILTMVAGALGLLLGWIGLRTLGTFGFEQTPQGTAVTLNLRVVAFTIALVAAVGFLIALAPVFGVRRLNLSQAFREEGRSGTASRGSRTLRRVLVAAQVAFAFMLLAGAGLMLASFQRILAIQPGFDPDHVLTGAVTPPASRYKDDPQLVAFADRLLAKVRALPGIEAAGITSNIPLGNNFNDSVIRREVTSLDPELPFYGVRAMQARVDQSLTSRRTPMLLGALFAAIAVFLACVGIYAVLAYQVAQRRREIGIRLALGSEPRRIFQLVLREGLLLLTVGLTVGFAGAVAIRRALETQLFGVRPLDPLVLLLVTTTLIAVAAIACGVPARRAAKIDPLIALTDQ